MSLGREHTLLRNSLLTTDNYRLHRREKSQQRNEYTLDVKGAHRIALDGQARTPGNFATFNLYPGKMVCEFVSPIWRTTTSPNRSRKSVVTARSRPSNRLSAASPGQWPYTLPPR